MLKLTTLLLDHNELKHVPQGNKSLRLLHQMKKETDVTLFFPFSVIGHESGSDFVGWKSLWRGNGEYDQVRDKKDKDRDRERQLQQETERRQRGQ